MLSIQPLTLAAAAVTGTPLKMHLPASPLVLVVEIGADVSIEKVLDCAHS